MDVWLKKTITNTFCQDWNYMVIPIILSGSPSCKRARLIFWGLKLCDFTRADDLNRAPRSDLKTVSLDLSWSEEEELVLNWRSDAVSTTDEHSHFTFFELTRCHTMLHLKKWADLTTTPHAGGQQKYDSPAQPPEYKCWHLTFLQTTDIFTSVRVRYMTHHVNVTYLWLLFHFRRFKRVFQHF